MGNRPPPVPPAGRSTKGPGDHEHEPPQEVQGRKVPENVDKQDQQGNTKQNTTNQGYQQDR